LAQAFVLLNTELGSEDEVLAAVKAVDAVKEAAIVYGIYDIILRLIGPSLETLKATLLRDLRHIPGVKGTLSLVVVNS
jgi:DNA-binding Lrp family transcriptional regulator